MFICRCVYVWSANTEGSLECLNTLPGFGNGTQPYFKITFSLYVENSDYITKSSALMLPEENILHGHKKIDLKTYSSEQ